MSSLPEINDYVAEKCRSLILEWLDVCRGISKELHQSNNKREKYQFDRVKNILALCARHRAYQANNSMPFSRFQLQNWHLLEVLETRIEQCDGYMDLITLIRNEDRDLLHPILEEILMMINYEFRTEMCDTLVKIRYDKTIEAYYNVIN